MDVREIVEIVRRRWAAAILLIILTLAATAAAARAVDVTHFATAKVLLQPPATGADGVSSGNPLTASSGSVATITDVVRQVVNGAATHERLSEEGAGSYTVSPAEGEVPLLAIEATSSDRDVALATVGLVGEAITTVVADQQRLAGAPEASFVTARTLIPADRTRTVTGSRDRTVAGVLGVGLLLSLTLVVLADGLSAGRRPLVPRKAGRTRPSLDQPPAVAPAGSAHSLRGGVPAPSKAHLVAAEDMGDDAKRSDVLVDEWRELGRGAWQDLHHRPPPSRARHADEEESTDPEEYLLPPTGDQPGITYLARLRPEDRRAGGDGG